MSFHACVWIDQRHAKIFRIGAMTADMQSVSDDRPEHHLHRKANHVGLGTVEMDHDLMRGIAENLRSAEAILIMGPGKAKTVFKGYLDEHFPEVAHRVWDVRTTDHPSDAQIVAEARSWFRTQDRMH
ncbi:translational machinery protein [Devosia sp. CN2-171]|uniref:translational machinery protein n=1 Tax=Devosia sp. CN2-171 TaxID=3400909 RepID=UPI003BF7A306